MGGTCKGGIGSGSVTVVDSACGYNGWSESACIGEDGIEPTAYSFCDTVVRLRGGRARWDCDPLFRGFWVLRTASCFMTDLQSSRTEY